jgi:hypothetical protein
LLLECHAVSVLNTSRIHQAVSKVDVSPVVRSMS